MSESPLTEQAHPTTDGDDDVKSTRSGGKSQTGSKPTSRTGSAQSNKSGGMGGGVKKPDTVPTSPLGSGKDNPAADWRTMRRIIAEDPEWSLATVPLFVDLCIDHMVANFECKFRRTSRISHENSVLHTTDD